jgi:hypothetical protein
MPIPAMRRRAFIAALGGTRSVVLCLGAAAQEGYHGVGHDKWHQDFYAKLRRNDGRGPCCGMVDCRPTQSRKVGAITKSKWTANGYRFPRTRLST